MVISTPLIKAYARLGQKGAAAGIGMLEVAKSDPNLRVVVADSIAIASLDRFYANYPDKVINVGIAEQNMIGIAAGIASESGSNVFACTYAEFIIARTVEMIRQNLSYHQFNVKLIGNSAGFAMETLAVSHWATEDIALVRALPNIIILSASDCLAAIKLVIAASLIKGPVYLRLSGGLNCPIVYEKDCDFTIGKSNIIKKGEDVAILATGLMVREAMDAAEMLKEKNVNAAVVDMYTIKPLDTGLLDTIFSTHRLVVTVEEHNIIGGLGSSIAEYKCDNNLHARLVRIGVNDRFGELGSLRYIWKQHGLTAEQIASKIEFLLK
ncbi:transketolase family protein [Bacteroides oleiciplenus]|uniref:Transketolase-like pyrimidine-binding domain-containing protein n=1 Tax=Bacteroides oleiciplenus YIT 12058 TaxID=742727 RepID=K9E2N1_9BACE|nr:transketolase C-terminal domain-containing protein [Bacteroides oleiciplenus]EKU91319.1 hypothetical protein HMPREF9447_01509 [Bacteroides oleiciplenus YIT 12058]